MVDTRMFRRTVPALTVVLAGLWIVSCSDARTPSGPEIPSHEEEVPGPEPEAPGLAALIVSDPLPSNANVESAGLAGSSSRVETVYASLPPGSAPGGERVIIRTARTGAETAAAMVDGGFDPIPVLATAGDTLDVRIELAGGEAPVRFITAVPESQPPIVVRTDPPPRKRDVR